MGNRWMRRPSREMLMIWVKKAEGTRENAFTFSSISPLTNFEVAKRVVHSSWFFLCLTGFRS